MALPRPSSRPKRRRSRRSRHGATRGPQGRGRSQPGAKSSRQPQMPSRASSGSGESFSLARGRTAPLCTTRQSPGSASPPTRVPALSAMRSASRALRRRADRADLERETAELQEAKAASRLRPPAPACSRGRAVGCSGCSGCRLLWMPSARPSSGKSASGDPELRARGARSA